MATARTIGRIIITFGALMGVGIGIVWIGQYIDAVASSDPGTAPETMLLVSGILMTSLGMTVFSLQVVRVDRERIERNRDKYRSSRDVLVNAFLTQETVDEGLRRLALNIQEFVDHEDLRRKEFAVDPSSSLDPDAQNEVFLNRAYLYHDDTRNAVKTFTDALEEARSVRPHLRYYTSWTMYLPSTTPEREPEETFTDADVADSPAVGELMLEEGASA